MLMERNKDTYKGQLAWQNFKASGTRGATHLNPFADFWHLFGLKSDINKILAWLSYRYIALFHNMYILK